MANPTTVEELLDYWPGNDTEDGAPSVVIRNPEKVIGDQAHILLAFWRHLDRMSPDDWITLDSAWASTEASALDSSWASAEDSARDISWASAGDSAGDSSWASAGATNEIQGAAVMRAKGLPFFFLPLFGFADPEAVLAADKA